MFFSTLLPLALTTLVSATDSWGPAVSFGPSKSTIVYSSTIIQPPAAPVQSGNGFLTLWPGMSNGTGNLIQSTLDVYPPGVYCAGVLVKTGEWCAMASVFGISPDWPEYQHDSPAKGIVKANQKIKIEYKLESNNVNWTQTLTDVSSNKVFASLSSRSEAYMRGWGTGAECQSDCKGAGEHYYLNTTIKFKAAEPSFTMSASQGATFSKPVTKDGGITWTIAKMTIPKMVNA